MANSPESYEHLIGALAREIEIPDARYESADRSYRSVSDWLSRPASRFSKVDVKVYTQGSFRLGTPIRPVSNEEDYDLDVVCEFDMTKIAMTQATLQQALGDELIQYAAAHNMTAPSRSSRCWTLNYSDEAQFHMDILPSLPDSPQRVLLKAAGLGADLADSAVAITDSDHPNFRIPSLDWPISNPNGYASWFTSRMRTILEMRRRAMLLDARARASVAQIPEYRIKTPLQAAVQILKRHRDMRFSEAERQRPSSIVITTLSAHAYQQESTISGALASILSRMDQFVEIRGTDYWIANPSDPRENFADYWRTEPTLKDAFYDWLETARADFGAAAQEPDPERFVDVLAPRMGRRLMEASVGRARIVTASQSLVGRARTALSRILDAPHRKPAIWPVARAGAVRIVSAECRQSGFRPKSFVSDGQPLPKRASLTFRAETSVAPPFRVYWQVVNTGAQARDAGMLRGGFDEGSVSRGHLVREESTKFSGSHSIECFIVKDSLCVAQSGPFVVNIE